MIRRARPGSGAISGSSRGGRFARAVLAHLTLTMVVTLMPAMALADDRTPQTWYSFLLLAGGGVAGWVGKLLLEDINGDRTARREFIKETSRQISGLAQKHYWALANHAGVLAGGLEDYLNQIEYHLLLEWDSPDQLNVRLQQIAKESADQTFYHLCRLIWLFDKFQFEGSNTYLLTSDIAGRSCRQLYNSFMKVLPVNEDFKTAQLDTLTILDVMSRPVATEGRNPPVIGAKLTAKEFKSLTSSDGESPLKGAQAAYQVWLAERRYQVRIAAQSMRAYNELLSHELAYLYRDWFRRKPLSEQIFAEEVAHRRWPRILSEDSVLAIRQARLGSELLQPLTSPGDLSQGRHDAAGKTPPGGESSHPLAPKESLAPPNANADKTVSADSKNLQGLNQPNPQTVQSKPTSAPNGVS